MRTTISILLGCLFVFLAAFNVVSMLSGAGSRNRTWIQLHRIAGYTFIFLFALVTYSMGLRIRGLPDELPPRLVLHVGLALLLAPLLFAKVIVARYQKASRGLLSGLGIGILALSFTLVTLNIGVHFLRRATRDRVPLTTSVPLGLVLVGLIAMGLFSKRGRLGHPSSSVPNINPEPSLASSINKNDDLTLILAHVQAETRDAKTLRFLLPSDKRINARPGQFLTFEWIIEGKPVSRSYSICSSPTQSAYVEITPKRVPNGIVSAFLNDHARPGLTVKVRGPYGRFYFDESKHTRIVLLAAGSGITPMIAMLRYIADRCLSVDCTLIYCVRTELDILFGTELEDLRNRLQSFRYVSVISQPASDRQGWNGRLRREILEQAVENPLHSTFFLCGPPAFMDLARSLLKDLSVDGSSVLQESFGGAITETRKPALTDRDLNSVQLKITYARSGMTCAIPKEQTVLESSEVNGILLPSGCRQGVCGTCATRLISGDVQIDYAEALTQDLRSRGYILPCVSRPLGDIVLDA